MQKIETTELSFERSKYQPMESQNLSFIFRLREQFDGEIAKMEADEIKEPCGDPKDFNSAAFAVLTKSGAIRMVVNFKPTFNRCFVDLDPWLLPTIDELMANIGSKNRYFATVDLKSEYQSHQKTDM